MKDYGRLTLTDILFLLIAIVAIRAFYPVFNNLLTMNAPMMDRGTQLLLQTLLPVAILVLLGYIYLRSGVGAQ